AHRSGVPVRPAPAVAPGPGSALRPDGAALPRPRPDRVDDLSSAPPL
ncbi:MAG: hypothetical protein AVDCRST_MAG48-2358, partial [uncultured Friedmanniella sp.]